MLLQYINKYAARLLCGIPTDVLIDVCVYVYIWQPSATGVGQTLIYL